LKKFLKVDRLKPEKDNYSWAKFNLIKNEIEVTDKNLSFL